MTDWLIDKSALVRLGSSPDSEDWASRIERGLVRITTVTRLEVGYSARSGADLRAGLREPPVSAMPVEYLMNLQNSEDTCRGLAKSPRRRPDGRQTPSAASGKPTCVWVGC